MELVEDDNPLWYADNQVMIRHRALGLAIGSAAAAIVLVGGSQELWVRRQCATSTHRVGSSCRTVLRSFLWSRVSGSYWENTLDAETHKVSLQPLPDRVSFYRAILLSCDLDTSRATVFADGVGSDAEALREDLNVLVKRLSAEEGSSVRVRRLHEWINELDVIAQQQHH